MLAGAHEAGARHGIRSGIQKGDPPVGRLFSEYLDPAIAEVDPNVSIVVSEIEEIVVDHFPLVTEAEHKIPNTVGPIIPHDVPQNRPTADWHHGLWLELGLFSEPRTKTAT